VDTVLVVRDRRYSLANTVPRVRLDMKEKIMTEEEQAFFEWWQKIAPNAGQYNLRMAFDAGYKAGQESK
jgi:hypothetical protein